MSYNIPCACARYMIILKKNSRVTPSFSVDCTVYTHGTLFVKTDNITSASSLSACIIEWFQVFMMNLNVQNH